jgi:hypothetical protein
MNMDDFIQSGGALTCGHLDICMCMFIMSMFYAFVVLMNKCYLFAFELCTIIVNLLRFYEFEVSCEWLIEVWLLLLHL